jgi:thiamine pyrophosphate-dependent acetolactate synthase large subunit-like protein
MTTTAWTADLEGERLIRVDIDERELTNNYAAAITVRADGRSFAEALDMRLTRIVGGGRERVRALRDASDGGDERTSTGNRLHPIEVCEAVSRHLDETTTVIADVGQNAYWVERHVRTHGEGRFMINGGLGSMGHGVTGAIGAWLARRDQGRGGRILCTCGDGGLMMGALELSTAMDVRADVTWVVFNNGTLGTQRNWFVQSGRPLTACELPPTDYVALAAAQGVTAERTATLGELERALDCSTRAGGPWLIDVPIDPDAVPAPYSPPA